MEDMESNLDKLIEEYNRRSALLIKLPFEEMKIKVAALEAWFHSELDKLMEKIEPPKT